jgi:hypothetical protein
VPREEIELVECNQKELEEIRQAHDKFSEEKVSQRTTTRFGLEYSPHYSRESRSRRENRTLNEADSGS